MQPKHPPAQRLPTRILLVDDDADTLSSISQALRVFAGADVTTATSGAQALAKLKETDPEAMVTDYRMPGMDGIELSEKAKKMHPGLPVVMITAFDSDDLQHDAGAAGICEVVPKPTDVVSLVDAIRNCYRASARQN